MTNSKSYTKVIKSDPSLIPEVNAFINASLVDKKIDNEKLNNLDLAVSEALSNAIVHGNKLDPAKTVTIILNIYDEKIEIKIRDMGKGFNPEDVPNPTIPENILKDSGRGIYIMNSFIDDVYYNFSSEGTELNLILSIK